MGPDSVDYRRLFATIVVAILVSVGIITVLSQATGYNLYTGDELESHQADRQRQEFQDLVRTTSVTGAHRSFDDCLADPDTTREDCTAEFPGVEP